MPDSELRDRRARELHEESVRFSADANRRDIQRAVSEAQDMVAAIGDPERAVQLQKEADQFQEAMQDAFRQGKPFLAGVDPADETAEITKVVVTVNDASRLTDGDLGQLKAMMKKWRTRAILFDRSTGAVIFEIIEDVESIVGR